MHQSMTGFASGQGAAGPHGWTWDLRSVNAKGLDLRLRVPDWLPGLEARLKARLGQAVQRGNVSLALRVTREEEAGGLVLNPAMLDQVLAALTAIEDRAMMQGISLAPSTATDLMSLRGVLDTSVTVDDTEALTEALLADFEPVLAAFVAAREGEGAALAGLLTAQLDHIAVLIERAGQVVIERRSEMKAAFEAALARVSDDFQGDPNRLAQELALLAVKADVTEELDRLTAHVAAARELLADQGPAGRRLDFLAQEFNREANTLCSKSQNKALTALGLELKVVIEQMREQVQNLE